MIFLGLAYHSYALGQHNFRDGGWVLESPTYANNQGDGEVILALPQSYDDETLTRAAITHGCITYYGD
jgi:hypothetical protein